SLKKRVNGFSVIKCVIHSMDSLYCELTEYNDTFWSKYLLIFWTICGLLLTFIIFDALFTSINLLLRIIFFYCAILFSILFLFVILTAASVEYENKKTYKLLNSIMAFNSKL